MKEFDFIKWLYKKQANAASSYTLVYFKYYYYKSIKVSRYIWTVLHMRCYFIELRTILYFKGILLTYKGKQFFLSGPSSYCHETNIPWQIWASAKWELNFLLFIWRINIYLYNCYSFHAHTLTLYAALCYQSNYRAAHALCQHVDQKQLLYAIRAEYMSGPLRQGFYDLLIALHLESHATTMEVCKNEYIIPLGKETFSK